MRRLVLRLIRSYQRYLNFDGFLFRLFFLTDRTCRFTPSCSAYSYSAVAKYGTVKGLFLGFRRVLRCHPWNKGGVDLVP